MNILPTLISGQEIRNHGGVISVWEPSALQIEFEFKRVYFLHGLDPDITRGHHAHKKLWQILLVTSGGFSIEVWDRKDTKFSFKLDAFANGLLIPPGYWRIFQPLTSHSVMTVFASHEYLEADYIRTLEDFYDWGKLMIDFFSLRARNDEYAARIQQATHEVLQESKFINGSHVEKFESEFAKYLQVDHVVGVANGLDALTIALLALEIGDGDEVIVPGFTFIATWLAVSRVGATLVPVDVSLESANLEIGAILESISAKTKAVIAVNLYGRPALNPDEVVKINALGVHVIEDAAQSHGVKSQGVRSGSYSDISCFSFYPTKNLGCLGDGGAIATNDFNLARIARKYANYGSGETKYTYSLQGLNSRLDSLQAAYLSIFLPHLDTWNLQRQKLASRYHKGISNPRINPLNSDISVADSVWHHFVIRVENRLELIQQAQSSGIQLDVHYPTNLPSLKIFEKCRKVISSELKNSTTLSEEVVSLPMYPELSHEAQIKVLDFLNDFGKL